MVVSWVEGDSLALPFAGSCFDYAVLHLILAVVSDPAPAPALKLVDHTPAPGGGWFRLVRLVKDVSGEEPTHPYCKTAP